MIYDMQFFKSLLNLKKNDSTRITLHHEDGYNLNVPVQFTRPAYK